jgi:beta-phosphoglucomutase family hydrolase
VNTEIHRQDYDAAVFDLDGVLTSTASLHASAWKAVFDPFLQSRAERQGGGFVPFDPSADYLAYVDGRTREDGIRAFMGARGISLPEGREADPPTAETVRSLGERKARLYRRVLEHGIEAAPGAEALLRHLRASGMRIGVVSGSKNCETVLHAAGLEPLVDVRVDGLDAERLHLPGKPDPALFLEAVRRLGVRPERTVLFEDAQSGVAAGRRGGFRHVVGIGSGEKSAALLDHGADVVLADLTEVDVIEAVGSAPIDAQAPPTSRAPRTRAP